MSKIFYDVPNSQTNGQDADETYLFLGTKGTDPEFRQYK